MVRISNNNWSRQMYVPPMRFSGLGSHNAPGPVSMKWLSRLEDECGTDRGRRCMSFTPIGALRRLHVWASDQGFLPIQVEHYFMLLDWTGRELRGQARDDSGSPGPYHGAAGAQSIELGGNGARLRPIIQAGGGAIELARRCRGAARGAGSRARRRLEPRLYRPLARRRAVKQTSPLRSHSKSVAGSRAQLATWRRLDRATRSTSHVKRSGTRDGRLNSVGLRPPPSSESGCAGRLLLPTSLWVSGF